MPVHLRERELLVEPVAVAVVGVDVDLVHRNGLHNLAMVVVVLRSGCRGMCRDVPVNADEGFCRHHTSRDGVTRNDVTEFAGDQGGASGSWPKSDDRTKSAGGSARSGWLAAGHRELNAE